MNNDIEFDIIIPCFNAENYVRQSVLSALEQTYENTNVWFVDNESTDNSLSIAEGLKREHSKLNVLSAPNLYEYSWQEPVAEAMKHCTGKYFTILAADDYIKNDYIEKIVSIIVKSNFKIKVLQSPIKGFTENSFSPLNKILSHSYKDLKEFQQLLFSKCPVNTPTVVYDRELYDKGIVEWKSEVYKGSGDYNCYFNFTDKGIFIYPVPFWLGYCYRWHSEQSTWGMQKNFSEIDLKIKEYWKNKWKII